jgi:hypothetical protein
MRTLPNPGDPDMGLNPVQLSSDGQTLVAVMYQDVGADPVNQWIWKLAHLFGFSLHP